jgi:high-affinity Fe2+/Pb2+ permease
MGVLKKAFAKRLQGDKASVPVAMGAGAVAAVGAGVVVYKLLRSD